LIINADGFGFAFGANQGIFECLQYGLVTSVSVNTSFEAVKEVKRLATEFPHVSIGVHLNLQVGRPVSRPESVGTLVDSAGNFRGTEFVPRLLSGKIKVADMAAELDAQVRVLTEQGIRPTHWDGHQNMHLYLPYFRVALRVARLHGITRMRCPRRWIYVSEGSSRRRLLWRYYLRNPKRVVTHLFGRCLCIWAHRNGFRTADRLISPAYADNTKKFYPGTWTRLMRDLPSGTNEVYCHPAYVDDFLRRHAKYVEEREEELRIFTSEELKRAVTEHKVELISFHDV
jgi:predicted glycoside hydrolase/deacetylase ChbG (UPF0249 family)